MNSPSPTGLIFQLGPSGLTIGAFFGAIHLQGDGVPLEFDQVGFIVYQNRPVFVLGDSFYGDPGANNAVDQDQGLLVKLVDDSALMRDARQNSRDAFRNLVHNRDVVLAAVKFILVFLQCFEILTSLVGLKLFQHGHIVVNEPETFDGVPCIGELCEGFY